MGGGFDGSGGMTIANADANAPQTAETGGADAGQAYLDGPAPGAGGTTLTDGGIQATGGASNGTRDATRDTPAANSGGATTEAGKTAADADSPDSDVPRCNGVELHGMCWYLTAQGSSCQDHCAEHGGYDMRTPSYVGTPSQGGTVEDCDQILAELGHSSAVTSGRRTDGNGYGCHLWENDNWWLTEPNFGPSFSSPSVRIACACLE